MARVAGLAVQRHLEEEGAGLVLCHGAAIGEEIEEVPSRAQVHNLPVLKLSLQYGNMPKSNKSPSNHRPGWIGAPLPVPN